MSPLKQSDITLDAIKRDASRIKKAEGIRHFLALDLAAAKAGFQNFKHAQNCLSESVFQGVQPKRWGLTLEAIWMDSNTRVRCAETLTIELAQRWAKLLRPEQLGRSVKLGGFSLLPGSYSDDGHDVLQYMHYLRSQDDAHYTLMRTARAYRFMDATGLKPSTSNGCRVFPVDMRDNFIRIPGQDHVSIWCQLPHPKG